MIYLHTPWARHALTHARGPSLFLIVLIWTFATYMVAAPPLAAEDALPSELPPLGVSFVGTDAIYLNGGRSHGLEIGQHITIVRNGEPIAELEVAFVSKRSASCRVVESRLEVILGDQAIPIPLLPSTLQQPAREAANPVPEPVSEQAAQTDPTAAQRPAGTDGNTRSRRPRRSATAKRGAAWANVSGTVSFRYQGFQDAGDLPRDTEQTTLRLNLRMRDIGGSPYSARIRLRGREDRRFSENEPTDMRRRDRLYELALAYEPTEGRMSYQVGRLAPSPLVGFDYLDGALAEVRIKPRIGVGAFYGQRSDLEGFGLAAGDGQAYGAFYHYKRRRTRDKPLFADVLVGAIREFENGDISRELISFYSRLGSGSRWSLYQRVDLDINRGWREDISGEAFQLSNFLLTASYRFSKSMRLGVSYDQRRRFRDFENRDTPEEIFDDRLREGFRITAQIGDPKGWRLTSSLGVRRQEDRANDAYTATGSIFNTNLGGRNILLGLDFSGFSGESSDGYRVSLRSQKYFEGGHDVGLTIGTSITQNLLQNLSEERQNRWIRLSGRVRLPRQFFVLGEVEINDGDDFAGNRLSLELGYRLR